MVFLGAGPEGFRAAAAPLADLQLLAFDADGGAGGMEPVIKTLEPMTLSRPMTVSPPWMEAPEETPRI